MHRLLKQYWYVTKPPFGSLVEKGKNDTVCFICSNIFSEYFLLSHLGALLSLEAVVEGFPGKRIASHSAASSSHSADPVSGNQYSTYCFSVPYVLGINCSLYNMELVYKELNCANLLNNALFTNVLITLDKGCSCRCQRPLSLKDPDSLLSCSCSTQN